MRTLDVEARYDDSRPEGGHAVVFFAGLEAADNEASFLLRPINADASPAELGSLAELQVPVAVRPAAGGLEIVIGPHVTDHPILQAGTIVEITLPDLDVRSEFIWPPIVPMARPKRAGLLAKRTHGVRSLAPVAQSRPRPELSLPAHVVDGPPALAVAPLVRQPEQKVPRTEPHRTPTAIEDIAPMTSPPPRSTRDLDETTPNAVDPVPTDDVIFYPHARGGGVRRAASPSRQRTRSLLPETPLGASITTAATVLGLLGLIWAGTGGLKTATLATSSGPVASAVIAKIPSETTGDLSIFDLLSVGTVSPRGVSARDVAPGKALEYAQAAFLTPSAARDPEEGAFWLKRYFIATGSDEKTRRALTQLGSALADSSNRNFDFTKARQVWELASAFGDSVAMCFLGVLHENGLTGAADRKLALAWFERAKQNGGCPAVDEAIARVRQ